MGRVKGTLMSDRLNLAELKSKSPKELLDLAEDLEIENASTMRKGEMMFSILKERADEEWIIGGDGVLEVLQDGFGFLRSPEANYLPGPDDIYVSPDMIRQFSLRTGDTVEGVIRAPDDNGERYFAMTKVEKINFEDPEKAKHKVSFDNLTPLYPDERLKMEIEDPTIKDRSGPGHRSGGAASARASDVTDRRTAAHRQDGDLLRTSPIRSRPIIPSAI